MISRRDAVLGLGAGAAGGCLGFGAAAQTVAFDLDGEIKGIEFPQGRQARRRDPRHAIGDAVRLPCRRSISDVQHV